VDLGLEGRVCVVTGSTGGIGLETAKLLATEGARVVTSGRSEAPGAGESLHVRVDLSRPGEPERVVQAAVDDLGGLDCVVNNVGITRVATFEEVSDEEWERVHAINLNGVFYANRAALPKMKAGGYGRIVNIASIAGKEGNPMAGPYSSSKAAVIGLTKAIGKDVAGSGVLVNCIAPAVINTPILGQISEEHIAYMTSRIPLARVGEPAEVAALICWLASEEMSFSTGACFDISGGRATY